MSVSRRRLTDFSDWAALLWGAVIGCLSLLPPSVPTLAVSDKPAHFAAYGVFGFLAVAARKSKRGAVLVLLSIIAYGGAIELIQPYVNRSMELADFGANVCGTLVGAAFALASSRAHAGKV